LLNTSFEFDTVKALRLRKVAIGRAQAALDIQVIKDSNFYCPQAEGTLQKSALTASEIGKGKILWATPYARRQYYEAPNKSHDKNPNARMKWFEEAKARQRGAWLSSARREAGANA
jgi:hypothetical protein